MRAGSEADDPIRPIVLGVPDTERDLLTDGPLTGIRVVELATVLMVPFAGQILGDLGADVIKVEGAGVDAGRVLGGNVHPDLSGSALNLQRNKRSVRLDLKGAEDLATLHELLATADVFITNIRPGALGRLALDRPAIAARHPHLVYCEAHGFRGDTHEADRPAFDDIIQAESGLPRLVEQVTGRVAFVPTVVADKLSALYVVIAVLAGLRARDHTGRGQRTEVAMFDAMLGFVLAEHLADAAIEGGSAGYLRILSRFRGPHATRDGYIAALPYSDGHWRALYEAVGREAELAAAEFATLRARIEYADIVYASLGRVMAERSTAEWLELCHEIGVPAAPVPTLDEIVNDPELHRGMIQSGEHPVVGPYRVVGPSIQFHDSPTRLRRHAPLIGEHTDEIRAELKST